MNGERKGASWQSMLLGADMRGRAERRRQVGGGVLGGYKSGGVGVGGWQGYIREGRYHM